MVLAVIFTDCEILLCKRPVDRYDFIIYNSEIENYWNTI